MSETAIQRYDCDFSERHGNFMSDSPNGDYVTYDDHLAALAAARAEWERELLAKCKSPIDRILNSNAAGIPHDDIYGWPVQHDLAIIGHAVIAALTAKEGV